MLEIKSKDEPKLTKVQNKKFIILDDSIKPFQKTGDVSKLPDKFKPDSNCSKCYIRGWEERRVISRDEDGNPVNCLYVICDCVWKKIMVVAKSIRDRTDDELEKDAFTLEYKSNP